MNLQRVSVENLELLVSDLEATRDFYNEFLGFYEVSYLRASKLSIFDIGEFILRFRETDRLITEDTTSIV